MTVPILRTKFSFPRTRPQFIPRSHLLKRLNTELWEDGEFARRLTLVSAPAGFGKTTLIAEWLHKMDVPVAWLTLEADDNDPVRFIAYLMVVLSEIDPDLVSNAQQLLQSPQPPPPEIILTALLNQIAAAPQPLILALDDFHTIQLLPIHQQINFLLEHLPPLMHIAVLTREDPPLPLSRMRAQGHMLEIRQADLRFSSEEIRAFLDQTIGLELHPDDIEALERRTEGWVAGLQLAALSMQGIDDPRAFVRSFTGSNRYILDYLFEEVFERQNTEVQEFLLATSLLPRLSGPLCDAVSGRENSVSLLAALEQANLFIIPLDQSRSWYRYHHLFQDLLQHRLRLTGIFDSSDLHWRACSWFAEHGAPEDAIHHALSGSHWDRAAALIQTSMDDKLKRGEIVSLLTWFKKIPLEIIQANPPLCLSYSWALMLAGNLEDAAPYVSIAEKFAQDDRTYQGQVASAQAFLARSLGDHEQTIESSERALSLLPEQDLSSRGVVAVNLGIAYWHTGQLSEGERTLEEALTAAKASENYHAGLTAMVFSARILAARGKLHRAAECAFQALKYSPRAPVAALAHLDLAALHYEWNDLETCEQHLEHSLEISQRTKHAEFQSSGHMLMARLKLAHGDLLGARDAIQKASQMIRDGDFSQISLARHAACQVLVAIACADLDRARHWAQKTTPNADPHPFYPFLGLTQPRLTLALEHRSEAASLLQECFKTAERNGWQHGKLTVQVLQILAAENEKSALQVLENTLTDAEPQGFIRVFVDAGERLLPFLHECARRGITPEYIRKILEAMEGKSGGESFEVPSGDALMEPLSDREMEVLRLIAAGLSNREIAKQLIISLGTVKTHAHNIYGKMGVRNRIQAVDRARELALI